MFLNQDQASSLALFCKVVDNYGDIGICWRLARQLQQEYGVAVTLWVDCLPSFQRICPEVALGAHQQRIAGVLVRHWSGRDDVFTSADVADIVIEFFGCDIPESYIAAMAQCQPRPVWLNLEGLTAEEWVEGCHTLPSSHPRLPLTKHFFFPGFTDKTGGLLCESALDGQRRQFQSDPAAMAEFMGRLGVTPAELASTKVSLFCYPHAPVAELFTVWRDGATAITCLVPEGVAVDVVTAFLGGEAKPGAALTRGALTVRVLPFVAQPEYDKLLWACDLNFVRGEDSFVRAQWAGKPFVWHIYPQDENLHHKKLRAFLRRYAVGVTSLSDCSLYWNDAPAEGVPARGAWSSLWPAFLAGLPEMTEAAVAWQDQMRANGDLTRNLLAFSTSLRLVARKNSGIMPG